MNHIARRGAEVITDADKHIHVSGHASAEELKLVLSLVKPRFFVPIHGEYRQLARHGRMAQAVCPAASVVMVQDGDVLRFEAGQARVAGKGAGRTGAD
jgi:ribonuclease J